MTKVMSIQEVREAVLNGDFNIPYMSRPKKLRETHVVDENKSVKWNREEIARIDAENKEKYKTYQEEFAAMEHKMVEAIVAAYANEYSMSIARVQKVYYHAYSEGHSCGMYEVFNEMDYTMDMVSDILETE